MEAYGTINNHPAGQISGPQLRNPESLLNKLAQSLEALRHAEAQMAQIDSLLTGPKPESNSKAPEPTGIGQIAQEVLERSQRLAVVVQTLKEMIGG